MYNTFSSSSKSLFAITDKYYMMDLTDYIDSIKLPLFLQYTELRFYINLIV